jgi:hypothetical protein
MKILTEDGVMNEQQIKEWVHSLYKAVDRKDVHYLEAHLSEQIRFRIGNHPAINNKTLALDANRQFFSSIGSMTHSIEDIMYQDLDELGKLKISCHGTVDYVRLDASEHSAVFSCSLVIQNNQISDYLVFVDLSGL